MLQIFEGCKGQFFVTLYRKSLIIFELLDLQDTILLNEERDKVAIESPEKETVESPTETIDINSQEAGPLNADILISNILPKGSKRVRFAFPKFQMPSFFKK